MYCEHGMSTMERCSLCDAGVQAFRTAPRDVREAYKAKKIVRVKRPVGYQKTRWRVRLSCGHSLNVDCKSIPRRSRRCPQCIGDLRI